MADLATVDGGRLRLHLHPGQLRAWDSCKRVILILSGTQGGKTSFSPHWLYREIARRGPGDYLVATPTYTLLELKALPEFRKLFEDQLRLGRYRGSPSRQFIFSNEGAARTFGHAPEVPTKVYFGHAANPDSLESATVKAAWLDEAGQKDFKLGSWEAIQRRLAIHQGRVLLSTTPYNLGWLKTKLFDPWHKARAAGRTHPEIDVIRFDSTENPAFPKAEFERAARELPAWKFDLFYRAIFSRPAGMVYDCWEDAVHKCPRFRVGAPWKRYLGLDFGGVNTAGVFFAEEPITKKLYAYREYRAGGRTAAEHAQALLAGEPGVPLCVGGSKSEGQWRQEFGQAGLGVAEPAVAEVDVGIGRVYGALKRREVVFFDDLHLTLAEMLTYSYEVDELGLATDKLDDKSSYHHLDACRYILGMVRPGAALPHEPARVTAGATSRTAAAPPGVFGRGQNPYARGRS